MNEAKQKNCLKIYFGFFFLSYLTYLTLLAKGTAIQLLDYLALLQ